MLFKQLSYLVLMILSTATLKVSAVEAPSGLRDNEIIEIKLVKYDLAYLDESLKDDVYVGVYYIDSHNFQRKRDNFFLDKSVAGIDYLLWIDPLVNFMEGHKGNLNRIGDTYIFNGRKLNRKNKKGYMITLGYDLSSDMLWMNDRFGAITLDKSYLEGLELNKVDEITITDQVKNSESEFVLKIVKKTLGR